MCVNILDLIGFLFTRTFSPGWLFQRFWPNCGRMAAWPKLNLCLSSTPTAAAAAATAAAERMNIVVSTVASKVLFARFRIVEHIPTI